MVLKLWYLPYQLVSRISEPSTVVIGNPQHKHSSLKDSGGHLELSNLEVPTFPWRADEPFFFFELLSLNQDLWVGILGVWPIPTLYPKWLVWWRTSVTSVSKTKKEWLFITLESEISMAQSLAMRARFSSTNRSTKQKPAEKHALNFKPLYPPVN